MIDSVVPLLVRAGKANGSRSGGTCRWLRIAELYFPSMDILKTAASSREGQQAVAHAASISSGGSPIVLVCEETITDY